jgi:hypothetical protein
VRTVQAEWLEAKGACGPDLRKALTEFGPRIAISRAVVTRARQLGINVLWAACQLADQIALAEFVAFTLRQRLAALEALMGIPAPPDPAALIEGAAEAWRVWSETGDIRARSLATALRQTARDMQLAAPSPADAEEAAVAAQRAASYAGFDESAVAEEQIEWFTARLTG